LELLLARLRSIAGEDNVGSPQLQNSHDKDAFTMKPFRPTQHVDSGDKPPSSRLAMRMFRPPQSVRVSCRGSQPCSMFWQGSRVVIASCAGPWHSSGSWWDGQVWNHNLWDVITAEPLQALRLQQDNASKAWFVVGLYD